MNHFFSHWEEHLYLSEEVKDYFLEHARFKTFAKGNLISEPYSGKAIWCYVCNGLVAGVSYNEDGEQNIQWFAPEKHFFTNTTHLFTNRRSEYIEVLQTCTLLKMSRIAAITGQQKHAAISELFHILKYRRINQYQTRIAIMNERSTLKRYASFMDNMPHIARDTNPSHHRAFLRMSRERYQTAKKAYLNR